MTIDEIKDDKCLICNKYAIEYTTIPCNHSYLCKRDGMKQATGGRCKVSCYLSKCIYNAYPLVISQICNEFFVELKRITK